MKNLLTSFLITFMYFLSGINKINNFYSVSDNFQKKLSILTGFFNYNVLAKLAKLIIIIVIILEIVAPAIIILNCLKEDLNLKNIAKMCALALAVFTVLATIIYHIPLTGEHYYHFMSNITATGALLLLAKAI